MTGNVEIIREIISSNPELAATLNKLPIILSDDDIIEEDTFIRPLAYSYESAYSDRITTKTLYGTPVNNLQWAPVKAVLGPNWIGRQVGEFSSAQRSVDPSIPYKDARSHEFAINVPTNHALAEDAIVSIETTAEEKSEISLI